jgi:hypothetical protein
MAIILARALLPVITLGKLMNTAPAPASEGRPRRTLRPGRVPTKAQGGHTLADLAQRSLLARVDAFTRKHPDIKIAAHYTTLSKLWEVTGPGEGTTAYDNGFRMMDDLERRYP